MDACWEAACGDLRYVVFDDDVRSIQTQYKPEGNWWHVMMAFVVPTAVELVRSRSIIALSAERTCHFRDEALLVPPSILWTRLVLSHLPY